MIRTAIILAGALTAAHPVRGLAQQLMFSAEVGKSEFFDGEPIYLLLRLRNISADTAWATSFGLGSLPVTFSVTRGNGNPVPVHIRPHEWIARPTWRGNPIGPGVTIVNTLVLQDLAGDEQARRGHLFLFRLAPDQYEVRVQFSAHEGVPHTTPLVLKAAPISFRIRERTAGDEAEVEQLESIWQMAWDTTSADGSPRAADFQTALIRWVEQQFAKQPDDPFLPFLLDNGVYGVGPILMRLVGTGRVARFDPDTSDIVSRLRLAVIQRQKLTTGGTRLVQALSARHPDQLAVLATSLGSSLSGEMARYQAERSRLLQRSRSQSPR